MTINDKTLNSIRDLNERLGKQEILASELLRTAKDRFGETQVSIKRDDKTVQAKQKDLWEEVYRLGLKCQAGEVLREKHPQVIEAYEEVQKITKEINTIARMDLDLQSHNRLSLKDILNLAEGIAEWKIKKMLNEGAFKTEEKKDKK